MGRLKALLTGIAVGASAVYLSDKKNRDKVVKKGNDIKKSAEKEIDKLKKSAVNTVSDLKKKAGDAIKN